MFQCPHNLLYNAHKVPQGLITDNDDDKYLDNVDCTGIYSMTDVKCAIETFTNYIVSALERFLPEKRPYTSLYPRLYSRELRLVLKKY